MAAAATLSPPPIGVVSSVMNSSMLAPAPQIYGQPSVYVTSSQTPLIHGQPTVAIPQQSNMLQHSTMLPANPGATSHIQGVVPTGLFTSYVPAGHLAGYARQAAYASHDDFQRIHESRMTEITNKSLNGAGDVGGARPPLTCYYTDDLYPPYYAKAKKIRSTRRGKPGCCQ